MSPRVELPKPTSACRPSKSFFRMKLATPLTASAPYRAEAPPVTTSTRSIMLAGSMLRSTPEVPGMEGTWRRPSTRVRVRCTPIPRRSSALMPGLPTSYWLLVWLVWLTAKDGNWLSRSTIWVWPEVAIRSALIEVTGAGPSKPTSRRMREPVTTTASSSWASGASVSLWLVVVSCCGEAVAACCANAGESPAWVASSATEMARASVPGRRCAGVETAFAVFT